MSPSQRSVFRDFIAVLRTRWRDELPQVRPVEKGLGPTMPKASTFYAGFAPALGMHAFVNFQHSFNSWQVGQFTINIILSKREGAPDCWGGPFAPDSGMPSTEGRYRISSILGRDRDKWWHLKRDHPPIVTDAWRPTSYDNSEAVMNEAAADVTQAVREALARLGVRGYGS